MNVIDWPPYLALIAAAFGTGGAGIAVGEAARVVPAEAMLSETRRAGRATDTAPKMKRRRFMGMRSFLSWLPYQARISLVRVQARIAVERGQKSPR
jgi:hypothetical protein